MILLSYSANKKKYPVIIKSAPRRVHIQLYGVAPQQLRTLVPPMPPGWPVHIDRRNWPRRVPAAPYKTLLENPRKLRDEELNKLMMLIRDHIDREKNLPAHNKLLSWCSALVGVSIHRDDLMRIKNRILDL